MLFGETLINNEQIIISFFQKNYKADVPVLGFLIILGFILIG